MDSYKSPKLLTHLSRADPSTRADPSSDVEQSDLPPATAGEAPVTAGEGWPSLIRERVVEERRRSQARRISYGRSKSLHGGCRPDDVLVGIKVHDCLSVACDLLLEMASAHGLPKTPISDRHWEVVTCNVKQCSLPF